MLTVNKLLINYASFALIATAVNIGTQDLVVRNYNGSFNILISVCMGTAIGLIVKYILDKRYIFSFRARNIAHDTQIFIFYTLMGLLTTTLFWGFEFGLYYVFETKEMRYFGGIMGLIIGYLMKYHLDKRYVFSMEIV